MMRRLLIHTFAGLIAAGLLVAFQSPAQAHHPRGDVYERGTTDAPYSFLEEEECDFPFQVDGRFRDRHVIYNVPGSQGQAYLLHQRYRWHEVLTNPANGKKMYLSGRGFFREVKAKHVRGDIWRFISVETGTPFVVRNARGHVVLRDHGKLVASSLQDTLGDGQPGSEQLDFRILHTRGDWPSLADDFDFCALVSRLIG